jgi:DNA polymerase elongation subunit (family B)
LDFYTNCQSYGSRILLRGIENGRRVAKRLEYYPTLFVPSRDASEYTTIRGDYVKPIKPGNIKETKLFLETYKDVDGFAIFGNTRFEYTFISDTYPGEVKFDRSLINVANIDIEVASEFGFPEPEQANEEITAITFKMRGKFLVLGCGEFENKRDDVKYIKCDNELHLIKTFLDLWTSDYPDIVTGWYIKSFDIPYLYNRISKLFGEKEAKRLSPWNVVWVWQSSTSLRCSRSSYQTVNRASPTS